jgi:ubiquinone/menaquinone biosynthesis C-methylase UbiE
MAGRSQREFFDSRALEWEYDCYPEEVRGRLADLIPEFGLAPGARVLDVGTGPGVLIPYLRQAIRPEGRICAFDLSFQMVLQARCKRLQEQDLVVQADAHHLPFDASIFDNIICFAAFPHFDDPAQALFEMTRVARSGARVVIAHLLSREELARHHGGHAAVAEDALPDAEQMGGLFEQAGLEKPLIEDRPGRYLATAKKRSMTHGPSEVKDQQPADA